MILSTVSIRAVAIIDWFLTDYPNFDGEIPLDAFFNIFHIASNRTLCSANRLIYELTFLNIGYKEGGYFKLRNDNYFAFKKSLLSVELAAASDLKEKIKNQLALIEKNKKKGAK